MLTVTVSQLNRYLKAVIEEDRKLSGLLVKGEISNFTRHYRSGHLYFTVKDATASIRAVMFRSHADGLRFEPENGMAVLVQGHVGVYERDGVYQLYAVDLQPDGAGALAVAFEQAKARLAAQGLFEEQYKKPLPRWPRRIGVVTSETGAALQDIVNVLSRRYPLATLVLSPALVQGREAPSSIIRALECLDRGGRCDVILLARGGGSAEDLSCFNDERLAHAVFAAGTPVISAVGHETDTTICDFVADHRAPTPSAAAELCTPSAQQLARQLRELRSWLGQEAHRLVDACEQRLDQAAMRPALRDPQYYLMKKQEKLDFLSGALYNRECIFIRQMQERILHRAALLDSLSPLRVLERGYSVAYLGRESVSSIRQLRPGSALTLRFRDGTAQAAVQTVNPNREVERDGRGEKEHDL